jgi:hypothetical protein
MNQVRAPRVGLAPVSYTVPKTCSKERKHEFAFEGVRYWDLLRYDHTLTIMPPNAIAFVQWQRLSMVPATRALHKVIDGANRFKATKGIKPDTQHTQISLIKWSFENKTKDGRTRPLNYKLNLLQLIKI